MSSSGIRDVESTDDRVRKLGRQRNSDIIDSYKNAEEQITLSVGGSPTSTGTSPSGNYMKRDGDEWLASFGNDPDIATITGGFVNISKDNGVGKRLTLLNPEGGVADNLDTLFPFPDPLFYLEKYIQIQNQTVTLRPPINISITNIVGNGVDDIITVTVTDTGTLANDDFIDITGTANFNTISKVQIFNVSATTFQYNLGTTGSATPESIGDVSRGNLKLPNDTDFAAPAGTFLHFILDSITFQMVLDYASNGIGGGGTGIQFPVDFPEDDRGTIPGGVQTIDFTQSDRHAVIMGMTDDISISLTNTTPLKLQITTIKLIQGAPGGHAFTGFSQTVANEQAIIDAVNAASAENDFVVFIVRFLDGLFTAFLEDSNVVSGGDGGVFLDSIFRIQGSGDQTKQLAFEIDTFTTGTTRTFSFPDANGEVFVTPAQNDLDLNTFDVFNIDQLTFMSTIGTLSSINVGFGALGSGSFRANILNNGRFEWTEENTELMRLSEASSSTTLDVIGILSGGINLNETNTNRVGSILQGSTTLQYTTTATQHEFAVGVNSILRILDGSLQMQGTNFITTPQIGFSITGNIIQDNVNGMIFDTLPGDDFTWRDGTNTFATLDIEGLFLNQLFIQFTSISSPGTTGSDNVGELFMDSGNSDHLSIIRNASVIDLEVGAGGANTALSNLTLPTSINQDLIPQASKLLGEPSNRWLTLFTDRIRLTTTSNTIFELGGDMIIDSSGEIQFRRDGINAGKIVDVSNWDFQGAVLGDVNAIDFADGHLLTSLPDRLQLNLVANEFFTIQDSGVNFASFGKSLTSLILEDVGTIGYDLEIGLDSSSPAGNDRLGRVIFKGRTSTNNLKTFGRISVFADNVTNGDEGSNMALEIFSNGIFITAIDISGGSTVVPKLGFFGLAAAEKPTASTSGTTQVQLESLRNALDSIGLINII